jgi:16S rRNA (guanine966-N2)-methyltransferase
MRAKAQIRIIAGSLKGRRLASPDWPGLRPTSDRLRETLFNVLADTVVGARVLDAFAGTGAVGIEAISRGAVHVTFVERDPRAVDLIAGNLARCGVTGGYTILRAVLATADPAGLRAAFEVAFLDPPYAMAPGEAIEAVAAMVAPGGRLVIEHARRSVLPASIAGVVRTRTLTAGDSALSFYGHDPTAVGSA